MNCAETKSHSSYVQIHINLFFFSSCDVGLIVLAACLFHFSEDRLANRIDCQLTEHAIFPSGMCAYEPSAERRKKKKGKDQR